MIEIQGTPKQVTWATDIREKALPMIDEAYQTLDKKVGLTDAAKTIAVQVIDDIKNNTEAKFWINLPLNKMDLMGIIKTAIIKKMKGE